MKRIEVENKEKNNKMTTKRWIFLLIYAFAVTALLIYILFIAPDKMFNKNKEPNKIELKINTMEEQIEHLLNKKYSYEYSILYTNTKGSTIYTCKGILNKENENGSCSAPKVLEYTQDTRNEVFKELNDDFLDVSKLFDLIDGVEPIKSAYEGTMVYKYVITVDGLKTEVSVFSNYIDIFDIQIDNVNDHYHLKYSNIEY